MLSVAGKHAEGLIYPVDEQHDMTGELAMRKEMILKAVVKGKCEMEGRG